MRSVFISIVLLCPITRMDAMYCERADGCPLLIVTNLGGNEIIRGQLDLGPEPSENDIIREIDRMMPQDASDLLGDFFYEPLNRGRTLVDAYRAGCVAVTRIFTQACLVPVEVDEYWRFRVAGRYGYGDFSFGIPFKNLEPDYAKIDEYLSRIIEHAQRYLEQDPDNKSKRQQLACCRRELDFFQNEFSEFFARLRLGETIVTKFLHEWRDMVRKVSGNPKEIYFGRLCIRPFLPDYALNPPSPVKIDRLALFQDGVRYEDWASKFTIEHGRAPNEEEAAAALEGMKTADSVYCMTAESRHFFRDWDHSDECPPGHYRFKDGNGEFYTNNHKVYARLLRGSLQRLDPQAVAYAVLRDLYKNISDKSTS